MTYRLIPATLALSLSFGAFAQEEATLSSGNQKASVPGSVVQKNVEDWVLTRQLISREAADWEAEKQTLSELNKIRKRETEQLDEYVKVSGDRVREIDEKRKEFEAEVVESKAWRKGLKGAITDFEGRLRHEIPRFPPALRRQMEDAVKRVEHPDPERPLQDRTRDVLTVLQAYLNFNNTITIDADIREIDGTDREVEIIYLGMTQAWYVDRSGKHSGYGAPTSTGWEWTADNSVSSKVRQAIDIQSRKTAPGFVILPFSQAPAEN